jgi:hypothetical protein
MPEMTVYDLCLAWNWEYDAGFARLLGEACCRRGLRLLEVTPETVEVSSANQVDDSASASGAQSGIGDSRRQYSQWQLEAALARDAPRKPAWLGDISFRALWDRASDSDERFQPLVDWARGAGILRINPQEKARWAWDKATMHLEFISRGLCTPHTIILPPFAEQPEMPEVDLRVLGGPFAIKPALEGGGVGVVLEATSAAQVQRAREEFPQEKVLLQPTIQPVCLGGRAAWFRVLYCCGAVYANWWDTGTHVYTRLGAEESAGFGLSELKQVTRRIAQICGLDLFSSEMALTSEGTLLVMDTVNDPVDLRLQSEAVDGVPDAIVENIASRIAQMIG